MNSYGDGFVVGLGRGRGAIHARELAEVRSIGRGALCDELCEGSNRDPWRILSRRFQTIEQLLSIRNERRAEENVAESEAGSSECPPWTPEGSSVSTTMSSPTRCSSEGSAQWSETVRRAMEKIAAAQGELMDARYLLAGARDGVSRDVEDERSPSIVVPAVEEEIIRALDILSEAEESKDISWKILGDVRACKDHLVKVLVYLTCMKVDKK